MTNKVETHEDLSKYVEIRNEIPSIEGSNNWKEFNLRDKLKIKFASVLHYSMPQNGNGNRNGNYWIPSFSLSMGSHDGSVDTSIVDGTRTTYGTWWVK